MVPRRALRLGTRDDLPLDATARVVETGVDPSPSASDFGDLGIPVGVADGGLFTGTRMDPSRDGFNHPGRKRLQLNGQIPAVNVATGRVASSCAAGFFAVTEDAGLIVSRSNPGLPADASIENIPFRARWAHSSASTRSNDTMSRVAERSRSGSSLSSARCSRGSIQCGSMMV